MEDLKDNWEGGETVCVDFDGTLTTGNTRFWEDEVEEPREEMIGKIRDIYYQGNTVIVWTARPWGEAEKVASRLVEWGVPYHGIRMNKGGSDFYIDDKAVRPEEVLDE